MKNLFTLLFLFILSITAFAGTRTGYYPTGQTKDKVLANAKMYEKDMIEYKYTLVSQKITNKYDYTQSWSYMSAGATSAATLRYQFLDDKVLVTMSDAMFISKEGTKIPLAENDAEEVKRKVYESLENVMVTVYFQYLQVSETRPSSSTSSTTRSTSAGTYDSVTKNYLSGDDKASAKKFSAEYVDVVLKKAYKVDYLTSTTADVQNIKYTLEDESGVATILANYKFGDKSFTIKLDDINYYHKGNKTNTKINKESSTEATSKFYNLIKDYFIDKHSNYIAPAGE